MRQPLGNGGRDQAWHGSDWQVSTATVRIRSAAGKRGKPGKRCESSGGFIAGSLDKSPMSCLVAGVPARRRGELASRWVSLRRAAVFRDQPVQSDRGGGEAAADAAPCEPGTELRLSNRVSVK